MSPRLNYGGLVIAGVGFFLTRFTVTLAIGDPRQFYLAGVVPLLLGLGLAAFGVALTVADVDAALVRTTAIWCVLGAGSMLVLVVLTLLGSSPDGALNLETVRSQTTLSTFLIGGSVGGTLTGLYAARNRRQRDELAQQTNRLWVLNRILRHEVLNAVTVIRGYSTLDSDEYDTGKRIEEYSESIEQTIEEVKHLTRTGTAREASTGAVDLKDHLEASAESVREQFPDADISLEMPAGELTVRANERLTQVFTPLIENAVVHASRQPPTVEIGVTTTAAMVRISVTDDGPGLPQRHRALLETGEIEEFDDPTTGFDLNLVRLLVENYEGRIETEVNDGTTVEVVLMRAGDTGTSVEPSRSRLTGVSPATPHLVVTLGAALLAGIPYGIVAEQLGGSIAAIGVFYGVNDPIVGWLTHEFHSAVFGFVFAGIVSLAPARYTNHVPAYVAMGIGWGLTLWALAAGFVAPLWLNLLGISMPIPTFSTVILLSHLAWGISLGVLTALGYRHVTPWLVRLRR
ncbi:MAG: HAMP domain-containing sensor histidine kinase [Halodesulfurarchaeum sp.]|nr:HAMP domain-containing sensor histidine kinase [Halodesulfurarchaeum sp.]